MNFYLNIIVALAIIGFVLWLKSKGWLDKKKGDNMANERKMNIKVMDLDKGYIVGTYNKDDLDSQLCAEHKRKARESLRVRNSRLEGNKVKFSMQDFLIQECGVDRV